MTLVPHHPPDLEAPGPGPVGQPAGVARIAPAPGQTDVDVDDDGGDASRHRRVDGGFRIDRHCHPGAGSGHFSEAPGVDHFIGQEEVVTEAGGGHPFHLGDGGAGEAAVAVGRLPVGQCRALVGLHVGTQARTGETGGHQRQVVLQRGGVHHQSRGCQVSRLHPRPSRHWRRPTTVTGSSGPRSPGRPH